MVVRKTQGLLLHPKTEMTGGATTFNLIFNYPPDKGI